MTTKIYESNSGIGERLNEAMKLKLEIDRLTEELDQHKAYLLGHMVRHELDSIACGPIKVSRRARASWTYSDATQRLEQTLKDKKSKEQINGTAVNNPTEHAMITLSAKVAFSILQKV